MFWKHRRHHLPHNRNLHLLKMFLFCIVARLEHRKARRCSVLRRASRSHLRCRCSRGSAREASILSGSLARCRLASDRRNSVNHFRWFRRSLLWCDLLRKAAAVRSPTGQVRLRAIWAISVHLNVIYQNHLSLKNCFANLKNYNRFSPLFPLDLNIFIFSFIFLLRYL